MARKYKKEIVTGMGTKFIVIDPSLSSFEGHPFFEEKAKAAKAFLKKAGLPKQLNRKK